MSKKSRRSNKQQTNQQLPILIAAGVAALILVVAFVAFGGQGGDDGGTVVADASDESAIILENITPSDYVAEFDTTEHFLLDVRTPQEFDGGHIDGAANISVETLASRLAEVPRDQPIVVYCRSGNRSTTASRILADAGFTEVYNLGGVIDWTAAGNTLVR